MLSLASDENFNGEIVRGLFRRQPGIDLVRIQDAGLQGADDAAVLEWAASQGRILLTHDQRTFPDFAYLRVRAGQGMPGVFVVPARLPVGQAVDEILLLALCCSPEEWKDRVEFLPLR